MAQFFVTEGRLRWRDGRRICLEGCRHGRKGSLFVPEGRLHLREGAASAWKGAVVGENDTFRARRAPYLAGGAPYLLRMALTCA